MDPKHVKQLEADKKYAQRRQRRDMESRIDVDWKNFTDGGKVTAYNNEKPIDPANELWAKSIDLQTYVQEWVNNGNSPKKINATKKKLTIKKGWKAMNWDGRVADIRVSTQAPRALYAQNQHSQTHRSVWLKKLI